MPIKARIDMLSTGVRTPVGIKVFGDDLKEIETIGPRLEQILRDRARHAQRIRRTRRRRATSSTSSRIARQLARRGLRCRELQEVILRAIGGENVTTTIEGRRASR
jgi:Cu(I)/Ag(I) efflux system membrane protein CusA/SilA